MATMEALIELMGKLPDGVPDEFKSGVKKLFQEVTVEAGKAKTDLETAKKGDSEYKKLAKKLKDSGLSEDQLETVAEQLGYKKTLEDEFAIMAATLKEKDKAYKELERTVKATKIEHTLSTKAQQAMSQFKTPEGQAVKISERFLDKKELFKDIDLSNEVLIQERVNNIVKAAYENQAAFMKEIGLDGTPIHKVNLGEGQFGSGKALDTGAVKAVLQKQNGSLDAAAQALTLYEQAQRPTGT